MFSNACHRRPVTSMSGNLIIVSAPSGAGKTTLVTEVLNCVPGVRSSISYTSRAPRAGEVDGEHYHFISRTEFDLMIARGEFLEWAKVHENFYGTSYPFVQQLLAAGHDVILTIDVQGAAQVRRYFPASVSVFIMPPSYQVLLSRLDGRGANHPADLALRLQNALDEIAQYSHFDYVVINDELPHAVEELAAIILAERCRAKRRTALVEQIRQTFIQPT
jgi:guanylate kinase